MKNRYRRSLWTFWAPLALLGAAASLPLLVGSDHRSRLLALNTLLLSAGTCAIALPLGSALAMLIVRTDMPGRRAAAVLMGLLLFVPLYLQAAAWQAGFGIGGWYAAAFSSLSEAPPLSGWRGAVWIHAMAATPWVMLIVGIGLRLVRPELEEQALLDGTPMQVFRRVTLRRALVSIAVAALWVLVSTAGEMTVSDVFQLRTYAEELYTGFALGGDLSVAPLGVLPGAIIVAWLVLAAAVIFARVVPRDYQAAMRPPWVFSLGVWRWPATIAVGIAMLLLIGVPLANLCWQAGMTVEQVGAARVRAWSAEHFGRVVLHSLWEYRDSFGWTLAIGMLAATTAVIVAAGLAWWARSGGLRAAPALLTAATCLAVPGPMVGMAIVGVLSSPDVPGAIFLRDRSIAGPLAAQLVRCLPLTILILWQAFRTIATETLEAAALDGAGPLTRFFRIALPQRWAALGAAWLVALAVATGDVAATASDMVVPPGVDLLSRRIAGMLHASVVDYVAGICLTNAAMFLLIAVTALWLLGRTFRTGRR